jgi:hypothetical protein
MLARAGVRLELIDGLSSRLGTIVQPSSAAPRERERPRHASAYRTGLLSKLKNEAGEEIAHPLDQRRQGPMAYRSAPSADAPLLETLIIRVGDDPGEADGVIVFRSTRLHQDEDQDGGHGTAAVRPTGQGRGWPVGQLAGRRDDDRRPRRRERSSDGGRRRAASARVAVVRGVPARDAAGKSSGPRRRRNGINGSRARSSIGPTSTVRMCGVDAGHGVGPATRSPVSRLSHDCGRDVDGSLPPCGGGLGWGVAPRGTLAATVTPHPGPPHKGGGRWKRSTRRSQELQ